MQLNLDLLPHQAEFLADSTTRNLALVGGYGCGKTYSLALKLIVLALQNPGFEGAALSPTYGMATKVLVPTLEEQLRAHNLKYTYNKSVMTFDIAIMGHTTKLHVMAAETYKRVAGLNLAFFGVDEADLIQADTARAAWQMLSSRLRRGNVYQGVAASTPEGYGFLYQYFVDEVRQKPELAASRRIIRGRTRDNPFLPPSYIEELEQQYPAHLIKAYLEGEFVNLLGTVVYPSFDPAHNNTNRTLSDYPHHIAHVGVDFNVGKMAAAISVVDSGISYTVDELYGARNTEELIHRLRERLPGRHIICYPDSSGKNSSANSSVSSIAMLQQAGFDCRFRSANPRVANRVAAVNVRLKDLHGVRRAFINTAKCPHLVKGLTQQVYDKNGEPDKTADIEHINDAYGYFIHMNWPVQGGGTFQVVG